MITGRSLGVHCRLAGTADKVSLHCTASAGTYGGSNRVEEIRFGLASLPCPPCQILESRVSFPTVAIINPKLALCAKLSNYCCWPIMYRYTLNPDAGIASSSETYQSRARYCLSHRANHIFVPARLCQFNARFPSLGSRLWHRITRLAVTCKTSRLSHSSTALSPSQHSYCYR